MFPPVRSAAPATPSAPASGPVSSAPAAPMAGGAPGGATPQVLAFRKALGVPPDQPAPESKVIAAMNGQLGSNVKQMAMAIASPAPAAPAGGMEPASAEDSGPTGASMFGGRSDSPVDDPQEEQDDEEPTGASMFGGRK